MVLNPVRRQVVTMNNYCAFSKEHNCLKWTDYELTRYELEEADDLCHSNWIVIQYLQDRVDQLEQLLRNSGIEIPPEL
jgi:hypothetical protein